MDTPKLEIVVRLDVMLARRKMRSRELAERIGITEQNLSLLKYQNQAGDKLPKNISEAFSMPSC